MWTLPPVSSEQEQVYKKLVLPRMCERRNLITDNKIKGYLTDPKLEEILLSPPEKLYGLTRELIKELFPNKDFFRWRILKKKKRKSLSDKQKDFLDSHNSVIAVFDYDFLKGDIGYQVADEILRINTCVYCNRQYTITVRRKAGTTKNIIRPDFDHYLPQSLYPFFALSLYNLIPSCPICNRSLKGTKKLSATMNPYILHKESSSTGNEKDFFTFSYDFDEKMQPKVILLEGKNFSSHAKKLLETFEIESIYNEHRKMELKDLLDFISFYSNTYLNSGVKIKKKGFLLSFSQAEAYRILFGTELDESCDNKRPFSKFKRDILRELGVID